MKRIAIIGNRNAGKGRALEAFRQARRVLWGWELDFVCPSSLSELYAACGAMKREDYEAAVIIGGDGTVNQAVRGLLKTGIPVLPYPAGTANDFSAELGIRADWEQVQRLIDSRSTARIDLVDVNGIPFATVAGIGLGARLTAEYNERRQSSWLFRELSRRMQSQVYTLLSGKTVLLNAGSGYEIHVRADVLDEKIRTAVVFICNQSRLGGDMRVASAANDNCDRRFSVLILPSARRSSLIRALVDMKMGRLSKGNFIQFSTDRLSLKEMSGRSIEVFGDGDILASAPHLKFSIMPEALTVYRDKNEANHVTSPVGAGSGLQPAPGLTVVHGDLQERDRTRGER